MKLNSLRMTNFRQHVATEIRFDPGITGIIGPNGSGKTTILEAVAYALYGWGRTSRELMLSLNPAGRPVFRVELEFELGRHQYRVSRGRASAELYLDGQSEAIATTPTAVADRIQRAMGMSREEFFRTYFTSQKELALMASMAPGERARFLSKVLGYEKLKQAQDMIGERRRTLGGEIAGLKQGMADLDAIQRMISEASARASAAVEAVQSAEHRNTISQAAFAMIVPRWALTQKNREKAQALAAEIAVQEREETSHKSNLERVDRELVTIRESGSELGALQKRIEPLGELRDELTVLDELYRQEGRRKALSEAEVTLREELDRLRARHVRIERAPTIEEEVTEELEKKRVELEDAQGTLEARRTEWVRERQNADTKLRDLRRQEEELRKQRESVVSLGEEGVCPTCSRPLGKSLHTVVEHLDEALETMSSDTKYYLSRFDQLSEMPPDVKELDARRRALTDETGTLERKLARVQLAVQELTGLVRDITSKERRLEQMRHDIASISLSFDAGRYDHVRKEIALLAPLEAKAARLTGLVEREPSLAEQHDGYVRALESVQSTLGTLRIRHRQMAFAAADYDRIRVDYDRCAAEGRAAEMALLTAQGDLRNAREALETAQAAGEEARRRQEALAAREAERRLHEELDRAFNEIRTRLNAELRPELSELASSFLRELIDSRTAEFELDERYEVTVLDDGVAKPVLSGGEEDLAYLVLRLAVSQMIAERSGQSFSLLVLDEVFGSLDETRRFNVLDLLRRLGDRFEQVILITHIEAVRDGLDNVITVRYDPGTASSVIDQELPGSEHERQYEELEPAGAA
ncbi:MAG TPA: SMC family ATPase [Gemmatimonadaceae bacterium]|jgi:exonuclease SbcC